MSNGNGLPLCGQRIFLYPGVEDGPRIVSYETADYRSRFDVDFIDSSRFIDSLRDDIFVEEKSIVEAAAGNEFYVPEYQRYYSWTESQHDEFWETVLRVLDLIETAGSNLPKDNYFGTIYVARDRHQGPFEVIDGQQRITTIAIVLDKIYHKIGDLLETGDIEESLKEYAHHVRDDILETVVYRQTGFTTDPFVTLNEHDNNFFQLLFKDDDEKIQIIKDMGAHDGRRKYAETVGDLLHEIGISETAIDNDDELDEDLKGEFRYFADSHKRLIGANEYYENELDKFVSLPQFEDDLNNSLTALINLCNFLLRSFRIAECDFETPDRALRIEVFQSLNDKGLELSTMDKINARIVARFEEPGASDEYVNRWENIVEDFGADSEDVEDFLANFIAATHKKVNLIGDAHDGILDAFRLRQYGDPDVPARLTSVSDARDFIETLEAYSKRYQELIEAELTQTNSELSTEFREECERILQRLHGLGTTQWLPFVLAVYHEVTEAAGKSEFFRDVLKTVENITFRIALSDVLPSVVDDTYPKTARDFFNAEEDGNQFNHATIEDILKSNIGSSGRQLFDDSFVNLLVTKRNWGNNQTKQLFLKLADEDFLSEGDSGITRTQLDQDGSTVHIEHVLPIQFIFRSGKSNPYAWLDYFFGEVEDDKPIFDQIDRLKANDAHAIDEDDLEFDLVESIVNDIRAYFVRDIGNMMLLYEKVNEAVQNRLLSIKLREYHSEHSEDMENIVNEFFSTDGPITEEKLSQLLDLSIPDGHDETDESTIVGEIEGEFNQWWTHNRMIERRVELIEKVLRSLELSSIEDEFEDHIEDLEDRVRSDFDNRLELRPL